ncbi:MAG TPA: hypothetical protein DC009_01915 [Porphyromonadaceae bacterium]|nr:hypothetical protein [Porphyromonadaceae bacterium]
MKLYKNILLLGALPAMLASCSQDMEPDNWSNEIQVVTSLNSTRAGIEDDSEIPTFMLKVVSNAGPKYSYYVAMKNEATGWKSYAITDQTTTGDNVGEPVQMLWADSKTPITVSALCMNGQLLQKDGYDKALITTESCQSSDAWVKVADVLYAPPKMSLQTAMDGKVSLYFNHLKAKVKVKVTMATEFNRVPGTTQNPIEYLKVNGTAVQRYFEPDYERWSDASYTGESEIAACPTAFTPGEGDSSKATAEYEALVIPSTLEGGKFGIAININGKTYTWNSPEALTFESNYCYTLPVTVGKDFLTVGNVLVSDWEEGAALEDGETDAEEMDVWDGTSVATGLTEGTGTEEDPYIIRTAAQLQYIAQRVNSGAGENPSFYNKFFRLANDIDLGGHEWTPIGRYNEPNGNSFSGSFDGNGHTIYNLAVNKTGTNEAAGFFGFIGPAANNGHTVKNLTIKGANIQADRQAGILGGIMNSVYPNEPAISNCHVSGTVTAGYFLGGLIGSVSYGSIYDCSANTVVNGGNDCGALVGNSFKTKFINCSAAGKVSGTWAVGGFTGCLWYGSTAKYCTTSADVNATDWNVGGFTGRLGDDIDEYKGYMIGCSASGKVSQVNNGTWESRLGGLIGYMYYGEAVDCCFTGTLDTSAVNGNQYVGALIGYDFKDNKTTACWYYSAKAGGANAIGVSGAPETSSHDITAK